MSNQEIRLTVPPHLYARIYQEAKDTGNTLAATVRAIIANHYREQAASLGFALIEEEPEAETYTILT